MDNDLIVLIKKYLLDCVVGNDPDMINKIIEGREDGFFVAIDILSQHGDEGRNHLILSYTSVSSSPMINDPDMMDGNHYSFWKRDFARGDAAASIDFMHGYDNDLVEVSYEQAEQLKAQFSPDHEISKYLFNLIKTMEM